MKEQLAIDLSNCEERMKDMHLTIKRRLKQKKKKTGMQTPMNRELKRSIMKLLGKDRNSTSSMHETPRSGPFVSPILRIDQEHIYDSFNLDQI